MAVARQLQSSARGCRTTGSVSIRPRRTSRQRRAILAAEAPHLSTLVGGVEAAKNSAPLPGARAWETGRAAPGIPVFGSRSGGGGSQSRRADVRPDDARETLRHVSAEPDLHGPVPRLRHAGPLWLRAPARRPRRRRVRPAGVDPARRAPGAHQRARRVLELREGEARQAPRRRPAPLPALPLRDAVPLQPPTRAAVRAPPRTPPPAGANCL